MEVGGKLNKWVDEGCKLRTRRRRRRRRKRNMKERKEHEGLQAREMCKEQDRLRKCKR
jgi:hypothetical protein